MGDRSVFKVDRVRPKTTTKQKNIQIVADGLAETEVKEEKKKSNKNNSDGQVNIQTNGLKNFIMPRKSINIESDIDSSRNHLSKADLSCCDEESNQNSILDPELRHLPYSDNDRLWISKIRTPKLIIHQSNGNKIDKLDDTQTPLIKEPINKLLVPQNKERKMSFPVLLYNSFTFNKKKSSRRNKINKELRSGNVSFESFFSNKSLYENSNSNKKDIVGKDGLPIVNEKDQTVSSMSSEELTKRSKCNHKKKVNFKCERSLKVVKDDNVTLNVNVNSDITGADDTSERQDEVITIVRKKKVARNSDQQEDNTKIKKKK